MVTLNRVGSTPNKNTTLRSLGLATFLVFTRALPLKPYTQNSWFDSKEARPLGFCLVAIFSPKENQLAASTLGRA